MPRAQVGSSPLTRGKHQRLRLGRPRIRLIPAHAGKTRIGAWPHLLPWAHPRSRGENEIVVALVRSGTGSSPLTRGKRHRFHPRQSEGRLIPAHAGKTFQVRDRHCTLRAHPRSRGENRKSRIVCFTRSGSSPLTRGKLFRVLDGEYAFGLIPAHAGKTRCARGCWRR